MERARLDRREFLRRSAALAGGAVAGGGVLTACGDADSRAAMTDFSDLASAISGRVVVPGDRGYRAARLVWNARYDGARPAAVVEVASADDVRRTVDFARDRGLRPIARSGAHSFAGYSTGGGVIVDLRRLDGVEVGRGGQRARLGAGSTTLPGDPRAVAAPQGDRGRHLPNRRRPGGHRRRGARRALAPPRAHVRHPA